MLVKEKFCFHLKTFKKAMDKLADACAGTDWDKFERAYDKADKDWTKLINSAYNLEDVQFNKSVNAYDKLIDKIDKIADKDEYSDDDYNSIASDIDVTANTLVDIQTTYCG